MPTTTMKGGSSPISQDREVDGEAVSVELDGADDVETIDSSDTVTGDVDHCAAEEAADVENDDGGGGTAGRRRWAPSALGPRGLAVLVGVVIVMVLASVVGWLGFQTYRAQQAEDQRAEFVQVARQGALNLTTIDWQHADEDVQRILGSATGTFYDDFSQRSQPFVDVVKSAQSTSVGTVTAAGLESSTDVEAQVLVAVSVKTTNAGTPEPEQRAWRMRLAVQKAGDDMKVSHVEFVS